MPLFLTFYLINLEKVYQEALFNILKAEFFYISYHKKLFNVFHKMYMNETFDVISVICRGKSRGKYYF